MSLSNQEILIQQAIDEILSSEITWDDYSPDIDPERSPVGRTQLQQLLTEPGKRFMECAYRIAIGWACDSPAIAKQTATDAVALLAKALHPNSYTGCLSQYKASSTQFLLTELEDYKQDARVSEIGQCKIGVGFIITLSIPLT